jgi:hypothetical protein
MFVILILFVSWLLICSAGRGGREFLHARYATHVVQNQILGNTRTDRQQVPARFIPKDMPSLSMSSPLADRLLPGTAFYCAVQLEDVVVSKLHGEGKAKWATSFAAPRAFAVRFNQAELRADHSYLWHGVWLSPFDEEVHECLIDELQNRSAIYTDDEQHAIHEAGMTDYIRIADVTQQVRAHLVVKIEGTQVVCPRRYIRFSVDGIVGVPAACLTDAVLVANSVI